MVALSGNAKLTSIHNANHNIRDSLMATAIVRRNSFAGAAACFVHKYAFKHESTRSCAVYLNAIVKGPRLPFVIK